MEREEPVPKGQCRWFMMCLNRATKYRTHPTLGDVPICDRCDEKIERLSR